MLLRTALPCTAGLAPAITQVLVGPLGVSSDEPNARVAGEHYSLFRPVLCVLLAFLASVLVASCCCMASPLSN